MPRARASVWPRRSTANCSRATRGSTSSPPPPAWCSTRNVEPGQVVGAGGTALFTIAKGGEMELLADLNEDDLAVLSVGATAQVTPVGSDKTLTCQIWQISPVIDAQSRQGVARCAMSYDPALRPGRLRLGAHRARRRWSRRSCPKARSSPTRRAASSISSASDNRVERRNVTPGIVTAEGITIVAGLTGTERVIMRAGGFLNEGDKVNPVSRNGGRQAANQ